MGLFRRRNETLNEQLLRKAGLDPAQLHGDPSPVPEPPAEPESLPGPESSDPVPFPVGEVNLGHRGSRQSRPNELSTMVTVRAASLAGARIAFTTLPDGDIIVDEAEGDADLAPLAEAVERHVDPPYRATAARQDGDLWAVGARRIEVAKVELAEGDQVVVSEIDGVRETRVDGEPSKAKVPELVQLGERVGANYCVEAKRIEGDFWEFGVLPF